jgi:TolA-binding protein
MKNFLFSLIAVFAVATGTAQSDAESIGKILYYEGKVEVGTDGAWSPAKINSPVKKNQFIRTVGDAMAEVQWSNGTKSVVGPASKVNALALFNGSASSAKTETESVFNGFKTMFKEGPGKKRGEEGGVRRSEVDVKQKPAKNEIYWKQDKEILFDDAYAFYEERDYPKAIAALQAFINQKPKDEMTRYAMFALGHSYLMANNPLKAKEVFQKFISDYPSDPLKAEAEKVVAKL